MSADPTGIVLLITASDPMAEGECSFAAAVLGDSDCGCLTEFCCGRCCSVNRSLGSIVLVGEIPLHDVPALMFIGDV